MEVKARGGKCCVCGQRVWEDNLTYGCLTCDWVIASGAREARFTQPKEREHDE